MKGGGAVAEWSKALLLKEKINKSQKDHRFNPQPGQSLLKIQPRAKKQFKTEQGKGGEGGF